MPAVAELALEAARSGVLPDQAPGDLPYVLGTARAAGHAAVLVAAGGDRRGYHVVTFLFELHGGEPAEVATFTNPWPGDLFDPEADLPDREPLATAEYESGDLSLRIVSGRVARDRAGTAEPRTGAFVELHPA